MGPVRVILLVEFDEAEIEKVIENHSHIRIQHTKADQIQRFEDIGEADSIIFNENEKKLPKIKVHRLRRTLEGRGVRMIVASGASSISKHLKEWDRTYVPVELLDSDVRLKDLIVTRVSLNATLRRKERLRDPVLFTEIQSEAKNDLGIEVTRGAIKKIVALYRQSTTRRMRR
jgi:hypothetical protein